MKRGPKTTGQQCLQDGPKTGLQQWHVTSSAVALHCCTSHLKINRKMEISTPCIIATPQNFILKFGTRDYVREMTSHANFGADLEE